MKASVGYNLGNNLVGLDATLKRNEWKEMAKLMGQPGCKYMYLLDDTVEFSIHGEIQGTYSEPQDIPLVWIAVPDQETAHSLGWVSILPDDKPYLAQIPWDTPNLRPGCRLQIPYVGDKLVKDESNPGEVFRITRVYTISRYPNCRMVQLAPEPETFLRVDAKYDPDKNYTFLNIDENE